MSSSSHSVLFGDVEQSIHWRWRDDSWLGRLLGLRSSWCEGWRGRLSTLAGTACTLDHKSIKNNPTAVNASPNEAQLQALATASTLSYNEWFSLDFTSRYLKTEKIEMWIPRNIPRMLLAKARSRPRKSAARLIRKRFLTIFPKRFSHSSPPVLFLSRTL